MTVNEVICKALRLVGRDDVANAVSSGDDDELTAEYARIKRAFLAYYNSVLCELSRGYFPLERQDDVVCREGGFALSALPFKPVKIKKVVYEEKNLPFTLSEGYVRTCASGTVAVVYDYFLDEAAATDEFCYPFPGVDENMITFGMAAEYRLVNGEPDEAALWENKYRSEIEALISRGTERRRVPARSWI